MAVRSEIRDDVAVVQLSGRFIGGDEVREYRDLVQQLLDENHTRLVVDMGEVRLVNSSSIGVLIGALKQVRQNSGDLFLARTGTQMMRVFRVMQLERVFRFFDSVDEAVEAF